jgi:hypothetical protein
VVQAPKYKDFWFKIIGCVAASFVIDALNREESFFTRLSYSYFYTDLLGGFVIALLIWETARIAIRWLDRKYSWTEQPARRITFQLLLAVCLPALLSFVFTLLFMKLAYNQDIFETTWLYNELYAVILIIILVNLIYFTWWLYLQRQPEQPPAQAPMPSIVEVSKAGKKILLPEQDIAYAYLDGNYCYIKTFGVESFVTTYTLDEVTRLVSANLFFRVNRQVLINKRSCAAYRSIENGKVEVDLNPPAKTAVIVSQKRAKDFRSWVTSTAPVQHN